MRVNLFVNQVSRQFFRVVVFLAALGCESNVDVVAFLADEVGRWVD